MRDTQVVKNIYDWSVKSQSACVIVKLCLYVEMALVFTQKYYKYDNKSQMVKCPLQNRHLGNENDNCKCVCAMNSREKH